MGQLIHRNDQLSHQPVESDFEVHPCGEFEPVAPNPRLEFAGKRSTEESCGQHPAFVVTAPAKPVVGLLSRVSPRTVSEA